MVMEPSALLDFMEPMFPLIGQMVSTPQDAEWHAEGDVRRHTEWVLAEMHALLTKELETEDLDEETRTALILGAALHDIGKTLTTREQEMDG
ncbi:MAG: HD-GYP domain-containing protein (c-di-GMP phosphodiesterase class II) [Verrucomicrobiales bacterium]|jgi:HD-GYP domain-containing protein (c-di-GMP phosphodiesterase class II)